MGESQTIHLGDEIKSTPEDEAFDTRNVLNIKYRLPPDGKQVVEKSFVLKVPGPFERRDIALTAARLANSSAWSALPLDFRAWAQSLATIIVMFRGQPDHEWLVANCEQNPTFLASVAGEVDAFQARSFPDEFVVGEGEDSTVVPAVEVATVGARRAHATAAPNAGRRAGVATVR